MKTKNLLFAAMAILAFASCSEDTFVGEQNPQDANGTDGAIKFNLNVPAITRADHVGADAADMLGEKFYVGGYKNGGTAYTTVFDNYLVQWGANTAGTTTDNTSDWRYVGLTNPGFASHISGTQTLKYWDYAAEYYDFVAYSPGKGNTLIVTSSEGHPAANEILATAIAPTTLTTAAYTLQGSATDLAECYIADLVTAKEGGTSPDIDYKKEVSIKFRSLGSKVRVALYETIPGYSVKDVKFYSDATTTLETGTNNTDATLFATGNVFYPNGTMTIKFPTIGTSNRTNSDYNKAHVTFLGTGTATSTKAFGELKYETSVGGLEDARLNYDGNTIKYLKRTSNDPSFAGTTAPYYLTVLPNETGNVLELRVDYTLESIDGSKETIVVHGATAFVPQIYAAWKPNYAYTYLFKISDNTNGWTKVGGSVDGLYPITFDAVVADSEEGAQSTITTVATPSITTYMKGHNYNTDGPEYKSSATDSIYIRVMDGSTIKSDLNTNGKLYSVTGDGLTTATEADMMEALNIRTSGEATTIVGRNGFTLTPATEQVATGDATFGTIPGADGNNIPDIAENTATRFLATAATYAYVYDTGTDNADTEIHTAVVFNASNKPTSDNWLATKSTYYIDEDCTTLVTSDAVLSLTGEATLTYYQKYTNLNKVYSVKVIRVVAGS